MYTYTIIFSSIEYMYIHITFISQVMMKQNRNNTFLGPLVKNKNKRIYPMLKKP